MKTNVIRPGSIVTSDELKKKLWSEDTFVDFDLSLNSAVKNSGKPSMTTRKTLATSRRSTAAATRLYGADPQVRMARLPHLGKSCPNGRESKVVLIYLLRRKKSCVDLQ
jgi:hypothetical protein